jgi:hypothetical protein
VPSKTFFKQSLSDDRIFIEERAKGRHIKGEFRALLGKEDCRLVERMREPNFVEDIRVDWTDISDDDLRFLNCSGDVLNDEARPSFFINSSNVNTFIIAYCLALQQKG